VTKFTRLWDGACELYSRAIGSKAAASCSVGVDVGGSSEKVGRKKEAIERTGGSAAGGSPLQQDSCGAGAAKQEERDGDGGGVDVGENSGQPRKVAQRNPAKAATESHMPRPSHLHYI